MLLLLVFNNSLIIQQGYSSSKNTRTITFPTAFTQISIPVIAHAYGGNRNINARITAKSVTTLTAYCEDPLFWIAIGY